MIAKQMDIRANIKHFFDIAYDGEEIFVPRKQNKNVVIISEERFNQLTQIERAGVYTSFFERSSAVRTNHINTDVKSDNLARLSIIKGYKENWNGNGAPAFSSALIEKVRVLLESLDIQPEIFPTALQTIQLEFDNARHDHMEIEIGEMDEAEVFIVYYDGTEDMEMIRSDSEEVNKKVRAFYG